MESPNSKRQVWGPDFTKLLDKPQCVWDWEGRQVSQASNKITMQTLSSAQCCKTQHCHENGKPEHASFRGRHAWEE